MASSHHDTKTLACNEKLACGCSLSAVHTVQRDETRRVSRVAAGGRCELV